MTYNYESPIRCDYEVKPLTEAIVAGMSGKTDSLVMNAVVNCGVAVDKDELIKALEYDRDQYTKGFVDGWDAANNAIKERLAKIRRLTEGEIKP